MKLRGLALNSLFYFLYMLGGCFVIMLAETLLVYIIDRFVLIPYLVLTILRIVIYTVGVTAILAAAGYYEGYREESCHVGETVVSGILAMIPHLLFAMLFKFQDIVSGAVRFTAGLLYNGRSVNADNLLNETPYAYFLLTFVAYGLLYIAALTVAKYIGANRRIMDRAATLLGDEEHPS